MDKLYEELQNREDEGRRFYYEIFRDKEYEKVSNRRMDIVIDLGANVGNFSFYVYNNAQVIYAIEANTDNYHALCDYVKRYNLSKIKPFNLAIGGSNDTRPLYPSGGCGGFTITPNGREPAQVIETQTLERFMQTQGIGHVDVLKIDIEGAELEVFGKWSKPDIDFIIGENHGVHIKPLLEDYGYKYQQEGNIFTAEKL